MTRTIGKLFIAFACTLLVLTGFQVRTAPAAAQPNQSAGAKGEDDQSEVLWSYGKITLSPHKAAKAQTMMISIDETKYVLSSRLVVVEQVEEKPGAVITRASNSSALTYGKMVSFATTGEEQPIIVKIVVDSVPHRK
ncbi:MAG: hypothetical protein ABFD97_15830 [Syntrophobacter sp.]